MIEGGRHQSGTSDCGFVFFQVLINDRKSIHHAPYEYVD